MTRKTMTRKTKGAPSSVAVKNGKGVLSEAPKLLRTTPAELAKKLEMERQALKALQDFDAGIRGGIPQDADEVGSLVLRALERPVDVTDLVEREQALALLARNIRMKETVLRIQDIQRTKAFHQRATEMLFDRRQRMPAGYWTSLFGKS